MKVGIKRFYATESKKKKKPSFCYDATSKHKMKTIPINDNSTVHMPLIICQWQLNALETEVPISIMVRKER